MPTFTGVPTHYDPRFGSDLQISPDRGDPAEYRVSPVHIDGNLAGRSVRLEMRLQEDVTPTEMIHLMAIVQFRVQGNRLAYLIDHALIRHFEEVEVPVVNLTAERPGILAGAIMASATAPQLQLQVEAQQQQEHAAQLATRAQDLMSGMLEGGILQNNRNWK
jgi:hypothetical protein